MVDKVDKTKQVYDLKVTMFLLRNFCVDPMSIAGGVVITCHSMLCFVSSVVSLFSHVFDPKKKNSFFFMSEKKKILFPEKGITL